jgi:hypothetical protein
MVDSKNCSFFANRSVYAQPTKGIIDEKALSSAQQFVDEVFGEKGIISVPALGKPIISMRDNGGGMYPYPMPMVRDSNISSSSSLSGVSLVSGSKDEKINIEYNTITIIYPYVVGGTAIYNNYGGDKM